MRAAEVLASMRDAFLGLLLTPDQAEAARSVPGLLWGWYDGLCSEWNRLRRLARFRRGRLPDDWEVTAYVLGKFGGRLKPHEAAEYARRRDALERARRECAAALDALPPLKRRLLRLFLWL